VLANAARRHRDTIGFGLLAAVSLLCVGWLILILEGGVSFPDKSVLFGYLWVHPLYVGLVVLAVVVVSYGEPSKRARTVVTLALGLLAVMLAFGAVTGAAALAGGGYALLGFAGVIGAGKVVGALVVLGYLLVAGLAALFTLSVLRALGSPNSPNSAS
jgi:hypothetical protein